MSNDFDVVETMDLEGFDPGNEPSLRFLANGALMLVFNAMPPFECRRHEADFDHLAVSLSLFLGTEVIHEDREFFLIMAPDQHSVARIQTFVARFNRPAEPRKTDPSNAGHILPQILKVFLPLVELLGFRIDEKENFLIRDIPGGWQRIGVRLLGLRGYEAELFVSIRLDAVDQLSGHVSIPDNHTILLAGSECGPDAIGPARITVIGVNDIPRMPSKWAPMLMQKVIPFLERYADAQALERFINGPQCNIFGDSIAYRAYLGVLIAHVAAPERFDEVVQGYRAQLAAQPARDMERLEEAIALTKSGASSRGGDVKITQQISPKPVRHASGWYIGESVAHAKFGKGHIVSIDGSGSNARAKINFGRAGIKLLDLSVAKLERIVR